MQSPPVPPTLPNDALHRAANAIHSGAIRLLRQARAADQEAPVSPERLSLLSILVFGGDRSIGELADAEQVSSPAISRTVKALQEQGLVVRRTAKDDRRRVRVHATLLGREVIEVARRRRIEVIADTLRHLAGPDLQTIERAGEMLGELDRRAGARTK